MCGQSIPAALHSTIQRKDFVEVKIYTLSVVFIVNVTCSVQNNNSNICIITLLILHY